MLNATKGHFDYGNEIGRTTADTEKEVVDELTHWAKNEYYRDERFRIKVLE